MPPSSIPTALIPPVTQPVTTPIRQYTRRVRNAQSSALPTVADEPASLVRDVKELARVLTSMDAAIVLVGVIDVPTGSGSIPTAGPPVVDIHTGSDAVPTASSIVATATVVTPYSRR
nr:hypothetical protein [Tanacetum cinerariifolium]